MSKKSWIAILFLSFWRFFIGTRHGLGVDEAHYVLYGLNLDWSYFDHPPLIGWIQGAFLSLLGRTEWAARTPAILSGILSSFLVFKFIKEITRSEETAFWSVLALNFSFLPSALWIMFLPDTLLFILSLWLLEIINNVLNRENVWDWISLGICLGLAGLSKYTAVFLLVSLAGIVVTERAFGKIKPIYLAMAALIGAIFVIPVFYWNMTHHWISFAYQQNHVMGSVHLSLEKFLVFLLTQIGAYSPFLTLPALWGIWISRKTLTQYARISLWIAVPTFLFFVYTATKDEVLPHWTLLSWGIVIPLGIGLGIKNRTLFKGTVVASGIVLFFAMSELSFQFIKFPPYQSPYADLMGWNQIHESIKLIIEKEPPGHFVIVVPNWTLGSRARFYLGDIASIFVIDERFDQFDLWEERQSKAPDLLVLNWKGFEFKPQDEKRCTKLEPVMTKTFSIHDSPVNSVQITWCRGFHW